MVTGAELMMEEAVEGSLSGGEKKTKNTESVPIIDGNA